MAALAGSAAAVFAGTLSFAFAVGTVITLAVPGSRAGWLLLAPATAMGQARRSRKPVSMAW